MTKSEIEQKIADVKAQGDALQKHNAQLIQQMEVNKVELAKVCWQNRAAVRYACGLRKTSGRGGGKRCRTRTITVDYARPRGYDVGYRAENNFTELLLPVPAELENDRHAIASILNQRSASICKLSC